MVVQLNVLPLTICAPPRGLWKIQPKLQTHTLNTELLSQFLIIIHLFVCLDWSIDHLFNPIECSKNGLWFIWSMLNANDGFIESISIHFNFYTLSHPRCEQTWSTGVTEKRSQLFFGLFSYEHVSFYKRGEVHVSCSITKYNCCFEACMDIANICSVGFM